jgi:hypothetical protein
VRAQKSTPKTDRFLVSFDRQFVDVTLISLIGSTTNLFPVKVSQVSNVTLRERQSVGDRVAE